MMRRKAAGVLLGASLFALVFTNACTGGDESKATDQAEAATASTEQQPPNATQELAAINPAIPLYTGAQFREDLTKRDQVTVRTQFGDGAEVYTLATDDSFPQVYHYYTTYLAQFRAFPAQETIPPERKDWRTLEVQLNQAMQDPFIPGKALDPNGKQVTLQIAETESEPKTVIRYIVTDRPVVGPPAPVTVASVPAAPAVQ